jgi:hypothetical protein
MDEEKKIESRNRGPIYSIVGLQMPKSILFGNGSIEELGKRLRSWGKESNYHYG